MSLRKKVVKGGGQLIVGQVGQQGLSFLRNLIVARLVSPDDFGIAASFAVIISMLDAMSDVGTGRFIVQAPDGDDPRVQNTLQCVMVLRGVVLGLIIFAFADLIARSFGVPEIAWAYRWLALVPVIKGFAHLDIKRVQRGLEYRAEVATLLWSQGLAVAAATLFALWLGNFEAMLWATLIQATVMVLASHYFSQRRFDLSFSMPVLRRVLTFGWPLLLNGALLFATSQGDRLVIGSALSVKALGLYAAAALIPLAPYMVFSNVLANLYLPVLASVSSDGPLFRRRYENLVALCALSTVAAFVPIIALGHIAVVAVFGSNYQGPLGLLAWLAIGAAARVLRTAPTTAALAKGDTKNLLYANTVRVVGFFMALIVVHYGYGLVALAASIALGELLATVFAALRISSSSDLPLSTSLRFFAPAVGLCFAALAFSVFSEGAGHWIGLAAATLMIALGIGYTFAASAIIRRHAHELSVAALKGLGKRISSQDRVG